MRFKNASLTKWVVTTNRHKTDHLIWPCPLARTTWSQQESPVVTKASIGTRRNLRFQKPLSNGLFCRADSDKCKRVAGPGSPKTHGWVWPNDYRAVQVT